MKTTISNVAPGSPPLPKPPQPELPPRPGDPPTPKPGEPIPGQEPPHTERVRACASS
jgi:hypothetical protein